MNEEFMATLQEEFEMIKDFLPKKFRKKYFDLFQTEKGRDRFSNNTGKFIIFDEKFVCDIPSLSHSCHGILEMLKKHGAPKDCYIIGGSSKLDKKTMPLAEALPEAYLSIGVILCCIPGKLAFYQQEAPKLRYILRRE